MVTRDDDGALGGERAPSGPGEGRAGTRILHTGDWHLGRRLFGIDRLAEAREVLGEIADLARSEGVDLVVVAGDLLDRKLVEPEVLAVCLRALEDLAAAAPVVAVTGNHDDPAFWATIAPYLRPRGIIVRTDVGDPADAVEVVRTRAGEVLVGCVPWLDTPRLPEGGATELARSVGAALTAAGAGRARPTVLLGHLMIQGALLGGGERELTVRDAHGIRGEALPADPDYVALGHIHLAQDLPGHRGLGRYCGSAQQLDFGESGQVPQVTIVEIGPGGATSRAVSLSSGRRLVRLRGSLPELPARAAEHPCAWFLCEVDVDRVVPDLVREVRALVPDALRVEPRYPDRAATPDDPTAAPLAVRTVAEHYADWYETTDRPLPADQAAAFADAIAVVDRV